jgi:adenylosuccinate synthase
LDYVIAVSGPVAVGKSVLVNEFVNRFRTCRVSTRQILIERGIPNDRGALIEAGKRLDLETDGSWIREGLRPYLERETDKQIILIDTVRTERQIRRLRETLGYRFIHVHITAPFQVVKERYESRDAAADQSKSYGEVYADPTESAPTRQHRRSGGRQPSMRPKIAVGTRNGRTGAFPSSP